MVNPISGVDYQWYSLADVVVRIECAIPAAPELKVFALDLGTTPHRWISWGRIRLLTDPILDYK